MVIFICGASNETSIGTLIGNSLREQGHEVWLTSRSGRYGISCDVCRPEQIDRLLSEKQPQAIIHLAGVWGDPKPLGKIKDWASVEKHVLARSLGGMILLDGAIKYKVPMVIFIAGKIKTALPNFSQFVVGNSALWSLCQFATNHTDLDTYYVELGVIKESTMAKRYLQSSFSSAVAMTSIQSVQTTINEILNRSHPRGSLITVT